MRRSTVAPSSTLRAWLKVTRLQFYPMTFIAYWMGAKAGLAVSGQWHLSVFLLGYAVLFFIEWCTVLSNEYYDFPTDRLNKNFSMFTGGSRVLVDGQLTLWNIRTAIPIGLGLVAAFAFLLLWGAPFGAFVLMLSLILAGLFLGFGYTTPPLKFSYRGFGEITVGLTHSFYVVLCGFAFQTGSILNGLPWLLSVPLFLAIIAANILAGIPDREADVVASKRSLAVVFGSRIAIYLAAGFAVLATVTATLLWAFACTRPALGAIILVTMPHAAVLVWALLKLAQSGNYDRNINGIMVLSLSYVIWFGLIPLLNL
jgi:1,4-dihydroxy-2-naphthoate polyprenyltransferase